VFPEGITFHDSCECIQPAAREQAAEKRAERLPVRAADVRRRRFVWQLIKEQVERGQSPAQIKKWMDREHPESTQSEKTLRGIIRRGESGALG
jgi:hypothetical protein